MVARATTSGAVRRVFTADHASSLLRSTRDTGRPG